MDEENIIKNINIKNYIKIFLLKKNIFTKIKIYYNNNNNNNNNNINKIDYNINKKINKIDNITNNNTKKKYITNTILLNYIIHYYPELNYKINKTYVTISTKDDLNLNSKVQFKSCKSNILKNNPCKNFIYDSTSDSDSNSKISYDIVIGFNQELNKSNTTLKLKTPLNLINIKCNSKNKEKEQAVTELTSKIEKLLNNNKHIKKYIAYIIVK
jgi:hypothetical protein